MFLHRFIVTCLLLNLCCVLPAEPNLVFTSIDCKNGLSENQVRNILQLDDGRMVITTEGVTNIYDGTGFKHLHLKAENCMPLTDYTGLQHGYVDKNYVWIKNTGKLMLIDVTQECFVSKPEGALSILGVKVPVADFFIDTQRNYWIRTATDKLLVRNAHTGTVSDFCSHVSALAGKNDDLYDIAVINNQLFLFYKHGTMICYDIKSRKEIYRTNPFTTEVEQKRYDSRLMVIQSESSLYLLRNGSEGIMLEFDIKKRHWNTVLKTSYWLNTLQIDNNNNIWVCCKEGLWNINKELTRKQLFTTFKLVDGTAINTEASTLYNDSQGGLWIGTLNRGLLYYHADRFKFKNVGIGFFGTDEKKNIDVTCFGESQSRDILVGTSRGLYCYTPQTALLTLFSGVPANAVCLSMMKDSKQRIWLCTDNYGLYCIKKDQILHLITPAEKIRKLCETPDGQIFATTNNGLSTINPESGQIQKASYGISVVQIVLSGKEALLGIGKNGLFEYNYKQNQLNQTLTTVLQNGNQRYNCIFKDSRGIIWIGTQDGLNVWLPRRQELHTLYTDDGMVNNSVKGVLEDKQGRIWVTTSGGVSRIGVADDGKKLHFSIANFNHFDGVIGDEFSASATYAASNGMLFMGGINGFNVIDLDKPWVLKRLQKPLFTNFLLAGISVKPGKSYNNNIILKQSIATTSKMELNHNQNFISIEFSAINYVNPMQTYYRYRLEGVDDNWREIVAPNGTGSASYTNLAPGTYIFEVKAANNNKEWAVEHSSITIVVKAPYWKTPLAYILYISIALLLLYLSLTYYKRWTQKQLMLKNEEKLNQIKFNFFTNVSHEFRTPLTLILTPLESVLRDIKDTTLEPRIRLIYRHARDLQNLVNQLLDFRRLEISGEKLNLTFGDMVEFVLQFKELFGKLAEDKNIEFTITSYFTEFYMYFDNDKMYKIINNLLSNAFKFTPEGGSITIQLLHTIENQNTGFIQLKVKDTGLGISANELANIFNRFYQSPGTQGGSGIGLHLVKEYVKLHLGEITVESEQNSGTTFNVQIPDNLTPGKTEADAPAVIPEVATGEKSTTNVSTKKKILIVEDNDDLRSFLANELREQYEIVEAADGKIGEEMAISSHPHLIISDVMMPNIDGFELCRRIKSNLHTSHIPVVLLTARSSEEHKLSGYRSGADEYLSKPFNLNILQLRIEKLIEQQKLRKEEFSKKIEVNPKEITITSLDEQLIQKALGCIEQNMNNADYSVLQFSQDMGMDRTVLYKKLQSITGLAPSDFIRSIRIKRAAQILAKGQYPVTEVAEMVGFNTPKYFSKYFKEAFGVTPSQYGQNGKNEENH